MLGKIADHYVSTKKSLEIIDINPLPRTLNIAV